MRVHPWVCWWKVLSDRLLVHFKTTLHPSPSTPTPTPTPHPPPGPRGLTFTWMGCYGLCPRHKPTELAHFFCSVLVSVSVFMALSTVFHSINSPDNSPLPYSVLLVLLGLIGPFNYVSLYESLLQPWYNSLWLAGLKAPTNQLTHPRIG